MASTEVAFQNPICRMATAGPAIFVEPWDVGVRKAKELLFTGEALTAKEGLALGFVNHVHEAVELDDRTEQMAKRIASAPPWSLRLVKQSFNKTLDFMGGNATRGITNSPCGKSGMQAPSAETS
jgi:enoyl-CoA hydratase